MEYLSTSFATVVAFRTVAFMPSAFSIPTLKNGESLMWVLHTQ
jgi:hypothetical protein